MIEPDARPADQLTTREILELVAHRFHFNGNSGQVTIELVYDNGTFRRAHTRSGPIGVDDLDLRNSPA